MPSDDFSTTRLSEDERLLMDRLRQGDRNAVAAIERRFGDELRLFCRRMLNDGPLAEDVVQDVLATCCTLAAESLPEFSIRGWLYQIARRRCIDARRRGGRPAERAREVRGAQHSYSHAIDPLTTPAGRALKHDRAARMLSVLGELDEELRSVVIMRYFQELSREDIAEAIGLTVAGAKARLSKAMELLRVKLRRDDSLS